MKKFKDSFNGLKIALNHKAVRIQIVLGILAVIGGLIIRLDFYEWLAFIICIGDNQNDCYKNKWQQIK